MRERDSCECVMSGWVVSIKCCEHVMRGCVRASEDPTHSPRSLPLSTKSIPSPTLMLLLVMLLPPNECMRGSFHLLDPPAPPNPAPAPPPVPCAAIETIEGIDLVDVRCLDRCPPPPPLPLWSYPSSSSPARRLSSSPRERSVSKVRQASACDRPPSIDQSR